MTFHSNQADTLFTINHDRLLREADLRRQHRMFKTDQAHLPMQLLDIFGDLLITVGQKIQTQSGEMIAWKQPSSL